MTTIKNQKFQPELYRTFLPTTKEFLTITMSHRRLRSKDQCYKNRRWRSLNQEPFKKWCPTIWWITIMEKCLSYIFGPFSITPIYSLLPCVGVEWCIWMTRWCCMGVRAPPVIIIFIVWILKIFSGRGSFPKIWKIGVRKAYLCTVINCFYLVENLSIIRI